MTQKDLVVLTPDKNWEAALQGIFSRHRSLGIRKLTVETLRHPGKDPGCVNEGIKFLSGYSEQYHYGLLMFDHEGCGREQTRPQDLQKELDQEFTRSTWGDRAKTVVLSPELDAWVWSNSPHVDETAGWKNRQTSLRNWLIQRGWLQQGAIKPARPKEAFEAALREVHIPRSSSLYQQIAEKVSLSGCEEPSFLEFKSILRQWFPPSV